MSDISLTLDSLTRVLCQGYGDLRGICPEPHDEEDPCRLTKRLAHVVFAYLHDLVTEALEADVEIVASEGDDTDYDNSLNN